MICKEFLHKMATSVKSFKASQALPKTHQSPDLEMQILCKTRVGKAFLRLSRVNSQNYFVKKDYGINRDRLTVNCKTQTMLSRVIKTPASWNKTTLCHRTRITKLSEKTKQMNSADNNLSINHAKCSNSRIHNTHRMYILR